MLYDQNLLLDSQYTYDTYISASINIGPTTITGASVAVISINGLPGPALNLDGGTTGYVFTTNPPSTLTLTGAANSIHESSGPTVLDFGAIANGDFLKRSGTSIIGDPSPSAPALNEVSTAVDLTLDDTNDVVFVDTSAAPVTITLHNPTTAKQKYYDIKLIIAGNTETIDGNGANIDGAPTLTTAVQFTSYTLIPDNTAGVWWIV